MSFTDIAPYVDIVASGPVTAALIATIYTYKESKKTEQFKISEQLAKIFAEKENPEEFETSIKIWYDKLFNTLEWFSFLVNEKQISERKIAKFFKNAVMGYYEKVFKDVYSRPQLDDPNHFPQFKKLYIDLASGKYD